MRAAAALVQAVEGTWLAVPVTIAVLTGARRGEVLGVRWCDIDLDRGMMSIAQTIEETDAGGIAFKQPKTERSRRLIALPTLAVEVLRRHRAGQAQERLRMGRDWQDHDLVCCDAIGRPLSKNRVTRHFENYVVASVSMRTFTPCGIATLRHCWPPMFIPRSCKNDSATVQSPSRSIPTATLHRRWGRTRRIGLTQCCERI